jgi:hypothetical protein
LQQEIKEDLVEELWILLLRQVARLRDHLHRRLLPELPAYTRAEQDSDICYVLISSHQPCAIQHVLLD